MDMNDYYKLDCAEPQKFATKTEALEAFLQHVAASTGGVSVWNVYGEAKGAGGAIELARFPGI